MTAHRYWRVRITENNGSTTNTAVAELEMFDVLAGTNLCTGGTPLYSTQDATFTAAKAFDGIKNADQGWATSSGNLYGAYIGYDFGSGVTKDIIQIAITARQAAGLTQMPKTFIVEYSDDNAAWFPLNVISGQTSWTSNQTRTFNLSAYASPYSVIPNSTNAVLPKQKSTARTTFFTGGQSTFSGVARTGSGVVPYAIVRAFDMANGLLAGQTTADIIGEWTISDLKGDREYFLVCTHPSNTWEQVVSSQRFPFRTERNLFPRGRAGELARATGMMSIGWKAFPYSTNGTAATHNNYTSRIVLMGEPGFTKLKMTFGCGNAAYNATITKCYVGLADPADPYNFASSTQVYFGGIGTQVLTGTATVECDEISLSNPDGAPIVISYHTTGGTAFFHNYPTTTQYPNYAVTLSHLSGDSAASTSGALGSIYTSAGLIREFKFYGDFGF